MPLSRSFTAKVLYTGRHTKELGPERRGRAQSHTASLIRFGLRSRLTFVCIVHGQIDSLLIPKKLQLVVTELHIALAFLFSKRTCTFALESWSTAESMLYTVLAKTTKICSKGNQPRRWPIADTWKNEPGWELTATKQ